MDSRNLKMKSAITYPSSSSSSSDTDTDEECMYYTNIEEDVILPMRPLLEAIVEEEDNHPRGGSKVGRIYINRDRVRANENLVHDYFVPHPTFPDNYFRARYRMYPCLFHRIMNAVAAKDPFFITKTDAIGKLGVTTLQRCLAALRMLSYGCTADSNDEYLRVPRSTSIESLMHFCQTVIDVFEEQYLRVPTPVDLEMLLAQGEERGLPGMLGSLDCMHWTWRACPTALAGQYTGHKKEPTLILEAVADKRLWIWHAFFGMPGACNDINVMHHSNLFEPYLTGNSPPINYIVNGNAYNMGYYLVDGIYPDYAALMSTFKAPSNAKERLYVKVQESCRKDVERAFGVLQQRWGIVRYSARFWCQKNLGKIMKCCIILHNMLVEDEGDNVVNWNNDDTYCRPPPNLHIPANRARYIRGIIDRRKKLQSRLGNKTLKSDIVEHLWNLHGGGHI